MAIRQDDSIIRYLNINGCQNKTSIRKYLLQQWTTEMPNKKYRYFVDSLANGSKFYLERPGRLNKGCDFIIYVENLFVWQNGNDKPPSFDDLLMDLTTNKSALTMPQKQALKDAIKVIYDVGTYQIAIEYLQRIPEIGLTFETILKLIKWFFAEQDLTYWSGRGRAMLVEAIMENL